MRLLGLLELLLAAYLGHSVVTILRQKKTDTVKGMRVSKVTVLRNPQRRDTGVELELRTAMPDVFEVYRKGIHIGTVSSYVGHKELPKYTSGTMRRLRREGVERKLWSATDLIESMSYDGLSSRAEALRHILPMD